MMPSGLGAFDVYDINNDGNNEIIAADLDNKIHVFDYNGTLLKEIPLSPQSLEGSVYSLEVSDLEKDGELEIIVGYGGNRIDLTHSWDEYYNQVNQSVGRYKKFLYRTTTIAGGIEVVNFSGHRKWYAFLNYSVNDIKASDINVDGIKEVIAGTGSANREEYWELTGLDEAGKEVWDLVEYPAWNSSVLIYDADGVLNWSFNISSPKANKIRSVYSYNLLGDDLFEVLAASDNGYLYIFNDNGTLNRTINVSYGIYFASAADLSSTSAADIVFGVGDDTLQAFDSDLNLLWKYKLPDVPECIDFGDIDLDEENELFVGGRDGKIYVFYENGALRWKHLIGEPIRKLRVSDLDRDDFLEVILGSSENITVMDLNKVYINKERAEVYYTNAYDKYSFGDLVIARIYAEKAKELSLESGDYDNLPKINLLLQQIMEGMQYSKKMEAEFNYGRGLEFYGKNLYNDSLFYIMKARNIYLELNDSEGVSKVDLLVSQIQGEITLKKTIEAESYYSDALNYFGFRNFTAAKKSAEEAKKIYEEIDDQRNILKINDFIIRIGDQYYDTARGYLLGLDYENARDYAEKAKDVYTEYGHEPGIQKVRELEIEIEESAQRKPSFIPYWAAKALPYILIILIVILVYSLVRKKRVRGGEIEHEESVADSIRQELDEMI